LKGEKIIGEAKASYSIHGLIMCPGPKPGPGLSIGIVGIYAANITAIMIAGMIIAKITARIALPVGSS